MSLPVPARALLPLPRTALGGLLSLAVMLGFAVPALSAPPPQVLTLWHGQGANETFWQQTAKDFNDSVRDVVLEVVSIPRKELNSTVTFAVINKEAPDMVLLQSDLLGLRQLFKLSEIPADWLAATVPEENRQFVTLGKQVFGIPISYGNHLVLYYNKALVSQVADSWEALLQQRTMLPPGVDILAINYRSSYSFVTFWHAFGEDLIRNDRIQFKNQETVDALNFYRSIAESKMLDPTCDYGCVTEAFFAGKYAYAINGDWGYENARSALGEQLGITQLPTLKGRRLKSLKSSLVVAYPGDALQSPRAPALKKFSEFIQGRAFAERVYRDLHTLPAHSEVMQSLRARDDPAFQALIDQLDNSVPMSTSIAMITAWDSIRKGFKLFIEDNISAEAAATYMQKKADYERDKVLARQGQ